MGIMKMSDLECSVKGYLTIFLVNPKIILVMAAIPLALYIYLASKPVAYEIGIPVSFSTGDKLELPGSGGLRSGREDLLADPYILFLNPEFLGELNHLITRSQDSSPDSVSDLTECIMNYLALEQFGEDRLRIIYRGPQMGTGSLLVYFFSRKVRIHSSIKQGEEAGDNRAEEVRVNAASRDLEVKKIYRFWDKKRLYPSIIAVFISFLVLLLVAVVATRVDSSLKTEQQAEKYTGLPVLGSFPDFQEIESVFDHREGKSREG